MTRVTAVDESLVFDIGMHHGEDTAYYVSRGYRVVGVEANLHLVAQLRDRFRDELRSGQVTLVPCAVGPHPGTVPFAVSRGPTEYSTADPGFLDLARQQDIEFDIVDVEMTTVADLMARHGTPYYMKVDVEGLDHAVVGSLAGLATQPHLLSLESATTGPAAGLGIVRAEIEMLRQLGYRRFKLVDQRRVADLDGTLLASEGPPMVYRYETGASGPFGDEAPGPWRGAVRVVPRMVARAALHNVSSRRGRLAGTRVGKRLSSRARGAVHRVAPHVHAHRWYDLHAAR